MVRKTLKDFGDFTYVELGLEALEDAAPCVGQGGNGNESPEQLRQQVVDCVTSFNEGQKNLFDKLLEMCYPERPQTRLFKAKANRSSNRNRLSNQENSSRVVREVGCSS